MDLPGHDPYAALRFRNYRLYLAGSFLATASTEMLLTAVGYELYQRTGSQAALGWAGLAQFLPVLLLTLPAGQLSDRHSRRHVYQAAEGLVALAATGLLLTSLLEGPVALFYGWIILVGVGQAFSLPARSALLPQTIPAAYLSNAITWNSSGWQLASVAGPFAAGQAIALAVNRPAAAYALTAGTALGCILLLAPIRAPAQERPAEPFSWASFLAGVRFVRQTRPLLAAITLDLFAVLFGGATALLPVYAEDILHVGPAGLGWLRAAPALGAWLMALVLAHRPPLRRPGRTLLGAVTGFGLAIIAFGLSRWFWLSFGLLALAGALDNISVVVRGTLVQVLTPEEMRGRVAAVNTLFISSSNELGAFESGMAAWLFGTVPAVVGGGVGTLLVVLLVAWRWPELLRLGALTPLPDSACMAKDT
jgi:MFS family permease